MRSVMLAAVHYGELSESPASDVVHRLVKHELVQEAIEVVDQPPLVDTANVSELIAWRHDQRILESRWRRYLTSRSSWRDLAATVNERLYRLQLHLSGGFRSLQWRTRQIEKLVTAKHIRAWEEFVQSPHTTLVVIESDATLAPDSLGGVANALERATRDEPTYVNLAGGFTQNELLIEGLAAEGRDGMTIFSLPVTNTSCAYAINRSLVLNILSFLDESPGSRVLGIDWLFNAFFINETSRGNRILCLHSQPPALQHGSITGVTQSWHPDR